MTLETVVAELTGTHQEVLAQIKARTITGKVTIWGADVQKVVGTAGLLGLVRDTVNATGTYSGFRDACIAMSDRFGAGGEINFSDGFTELLMDEFLGNQSVIDIVAASPYVTTQNLRDAVLAQATRQLPEFPDVTLRDIIAIRDPALLIPTYAGIVLVGSALDTFELILTADLPEPTKLTVELTHDGSLWVPYPVIGLDSVHLQGNYLFRFPLDPYPVTTVSTHLRVTSPYAVQMAL